MIFENNHNFLKKLDIIVVNVSYFSGMAGTKRVRNIIEPHKQKHNVSIYNIFFSKQEQLVDSENIVCIATESKFFFINRQYRRAKKLLKNIAKNHESSNSVIYHYGYPNLKTLPLLITAKLLKYKILFDIVEDNRLFLKEKKYSLKSQVNNYISTQLIKYVHVFAQGIIVISKHIERYIRDTVKAGIKILFIPVSADVNSLYGIFDDEHKDVQVFYGGSFAPKDGIAILISAFEEVCKTNNSTVLILTGDGDKRDIQKAIEKIDGSPAKDKIKFLGYLDNVQFERALKTADILCMTRVNSAFASAGFPFKLGEYLATGKAVIATDVGEVKDFIINGVNALLIEAGSVTSMAEAMHRLVNDAKLRHQLGNGGRQLALTQFNSSTHSELFYSFMENIFD